MTKLFLKYASIVLAIYAVSMLFGGAYIRSAFSVLSMGLVLLLVNLVLKPILLLLTLPFNLLTFGLFSFVVNALTIMVADGLVPGVHMGGFLHCLIAAVIIVVFHNLLLDMNQSSDRHRQN